MTMHATFSSESRYFGPNWFASVMGTGIVANAGAILPVHSTLLHDFSLGVWVLSAVLLVILVVATFVHQLRNPEQVRHYGHDLQMAQFYGAPPMALLTVGAGALLVGKSLIGLHTAVQLDWVLWSIGTVLGLLTAVIIPYRLFTQIDVPVDAAFGGWLMPVVPPMVSAATGALLIAHVGSTSGRADLLYLCYAMFGMSLIAAMIIITLIWSRLVHYGSSFGPRVPTLWIVLGPLGQSITAVGLLGAQAPSAVNAHLASAMADFAILYGVPVWGFAMLWASLASLVTLRTIQRRLPFALTWWSFTFPVGVTVTGTIRLAVETKLGAFRWASIVGYALLVAAWLVVATRTLLGARRGSLTTPPAPGATTPTAAKLTFEE